MYAASRLFSRPLPTRGCPRAPCTPQITRFVSANISEWSKWTRMLPQGESVGPTSTALA